MIYLNCYHYLKVNAKSSDMFISVCIRPVTEILTTCNNDHLKQLYRKGVLCI